MKFTLLALFTVLTGSLYAQHYYNDIEGAQAMGLRMKTYVSAGVKKSMATGFDASGAKSPDYNEYLEVDPKNRTLRISTRNKQDITRQTYRFNEQFVLTGSSDTTGNIQSTATYQYNSDNRLTLLRIVTVDPQNEINETTEHQWFYNSTGKPEKMLRIVNKRDTSEFRFKPDEKGNVGEEQLFRRNVGLEQVYYYYDEQNRLTDIVRYDKKLKKLLPDFMFEYDDQHRVIQKIATLPTGTRVHPQGIYNYWDYVIWRYIYNDKGLRTKEVLFNRDKEQTGKIEYSYTVAP